MILVAVLVSLLGIFGLFLVLYYWDKKYIGRLNSNPDSVQVVTDLDRLVAEGVGFKWKGKVHLIKPMTNRTFLQVMSELGKMKELDKVEIKDHRTVLLAYSGLFATVCDTIHFRDVEQMTQAQIAALFKQIISTVTGEAQLESTEKKTVQMANTA